jgi:mannosyltransferase
MSGRSSGEVTGTFRRALKASASHLQSHFPGQSRFASARHLETVIFGVPILLLAFALRFYRLDGQSLWADEGNSLVQAGRSLMEITANTALDIHPPFYYYLLHFWVQVLGQSEFALRSLSAMSGVLLVGLVLLLGRRLSGLKVGLVAAFVAALSPFQVYYAQEARMYMLLATLGALTVYITMRFARAEMREGVNLYLWGTAYVLAAAGGLYTHYAFPVVLVVTNLSYAIWLASTWRNGQGPWRLGRWSLLQAIPLLLYVPWLPVAYRQLTTWPAPAQRAPPEAVVGTLLHLLSVGLSVSEPQALYLALAFAFLAAVGLWPRRASLLRGRTFRWLLLLLYLALPALLTAVLFKPAYLKFLLVASPAFCLAIGRGVALPWQGERKGRAGIRWAWLAIWLSFVAVVSAVSLRNYYFDPRYARDDYRGIARYVEAVEALHDAVILNAPGQQEIFRYYYHGRLPIYPLPSQRPPDPEQTTAELQALTQGRDRLFALFWATAESDPDNLVEGWLDRHTYKAWDAWHGNVRLAIYAVPLSEALVGQRQVGASVGRSIRLRSYTLPGGPVTSGNILRLTLFWEAVERPAERYKVFVHLAREDGQVAAQRDSEAGGGWRPATSWAAGEVITDNYGVLIPPGTPPGSYHLLVGMYDPTNGERLPVTLAGGETRDHVPLGEVIVERPLAPPPVAALNMQHSAGQNFGDLELLGYDLYRLGYAHAPDTPLHPGDPLHVVLFWRAVRRPGADVQFALRVVDSRGQAWASREGPPVSGYPTTAWEAGEVVRAQADVLLPGDLPPGQYRLRVESATGRVSFTSEPFTVE